MYFPKHKTIEFEFDIEIEGRIILIEAEGVIGNDSYLNREDTGRSKTRVIRLWEILEDETRVPYLPVDDYLLWVHSETWEYFQVNFVAHSSRDEL